MSDKHSRLEALQLACGLARSGDGLSHDTTELVVSAAKQFEDFISNDPILNEERKAAADAGFQIKMATTREGQSYASGIQLRSLGYPSDQKAEDVCPHCAAFNADLRLAGLPGLSDEVASFGLPKGVEGILLDAGVNTLNDLIHAGPHIVMMLPTEDLTAFGEFMQPIIHILEKHQQQTPAEDDAPLSALTSSEYSGFPLNHFENLTPATVLTLNQLGAVTIGDITNNPQIVASLMFKSHLERGQLTNLLRHVVTNLTHNAADPSLSKERQEVVTAQISKLSTAINALEHINEFKRNAEEGRPFNIGVVIESLRAVPGFGEMLRNAATKLGEVAQQKSGGSIMSFEQFVDSLKQADGKPPTKH